MNHRNIQIHILFNYKYKNFTFILINHIKHSVIINIDKCESVNFDVTSLKVINRGILLCNNTYRSADNEHILINKVSGLLNTAEQRFTGFYQIFKRNI